MREGIAIVAAALVAFLAGYWVGGGAASSDGVRQELAALRAEVETLKQARPAPGRQQAAQRQQRRGPDPEQVYQVKIEGSPIKGSEDGRITIVEFSDFQCPFCGRVTPTLERLLKEYPEEVRVVYKHLPLSFHQQALPAAKAAAAAGRQGKFWEMHDLLFENQRNLDEATFKKHAESLGLDVARFEKDYASTEVAKQVADDMREAQRLGVSGTPGFFINGKFLSGAQPYDRFRAMVEAELEDLS